MKITDSRTETRHSYSRLSCGETFSFAPDKAVCIKVNEQMYLFQDEWVSLNEDKVWKCSSMDINLMNKKVIKINSELKLRD